MSNLFLKSSRTSEVRKVLRLSGKKQENIWRKDYALNVINQGIDNIINVSIKRSSIGGNKWRQGACNRDDIYAFDNHVSALVINLEVEKEPIVVQIKSFFSSSFFTMILIDSGNLHNMMSSSLARKLGLSLIHIKSCLVSLPNSEFNAVDHHKLNISVDIHGVERVADFEV